MANTGERAFRSRPTCTVITLVLTIAGVTMVQACTGDEDPYLTRKTGSNADVYPDRVGSYLKLEKCEYEVASITGAKRPDANEDRRRRALEVNADAKALQACQRQLHRLRQDMG